MGKWDDRVATHPVNELFASVVTALEGLSDERVKQAPEDI